MRKMCLILSLMLINVTPPTYAFFGGNADSVTIKVEGNKVTWDKESAGKQELMRQFVGQLKSQAAIDINTIYAGTEAYNLPQHAMFIKTKAGSLYLVASNYLNLVKTVKYCRDYRKVYKEACTGFYKSTTAPRAEILLERAERAYSGLAQRHYLIVPQDTYYDILMDELAYSIEAKKYWSSKLQKYFPEIDIFNAERSTTAVALAEDLLASMEEELKK